MKSVIFSLSLLLCSTTQVLGASVQKARSTPALEFDFTRDEGCDSTPVQSDTYAAAGKCVSFTSHGNFGAQVSNLLQRNVRLQLFSDSACTTSKAVFGNNVMAPGADYCFGDIAVANSVIVSLA